MRKEFSRRPPAAAVVPVLQTSLSLVDTPTFVDGIGRRLRTAEPTGEEVETLRLCRELSEAKSTEAMLIDRAAKVGGFTHPAFAQVRRIERLHGALGGLAIVSAAVPGVRLSELLALAQRKWLPPDFDATLYLLEQVTSAMAALHHHSRDLSHGALGPERIVVRPDGQPVIVEHVLGPALVQLQMGRVPLWSQFRIPVPATAGAARLDQMTDITQAGVLALALILGRPIRREEFPTKLQDLLSEASTPGVLGARPAVARALHGWIRRTLNLESRTAFRTMADAAAAMGALSAEQAPKVSAAAVVRYAEACRASDDVSPLAGVLSGRQDERREPDRNATVRISRTRPSPAAASSAPEDPSSEKRGQAPFSISAPAEADEKRGQAPFADWRKGVRVTAVALGLVALFGATYLGARGYFGLPSLLASKGTLVVESTPPGADLFVDGQPSGLYPRHAGTRRGRAHPGPPTRQEDHAGSGRGRFGRPPRRAGRDPAAAREEPGPAAQPRSAPELAGAAAGRAGIRQVGPLDAARSSPLPLPRQGSNDSSRCIAPMRHARPARIQPPGLPARVLRQNSPRFG